MFPKCNRPQPQKPGRPCTRAAVPGNSSGILQVAGPCGLIPRPGHLLNGHDRSDRTSGPLMTPEAWGRVKTILAEALDLAPGERAGYLDTACAGDDALRTEVESLLTAGGGEWNFFDSPPEVRLPDTEPEGPEGSEGRRSRAGERIGAYELLSELGRGGMGMVYLARRADDQFQKKVAVKLIRPGMASEFALERFRSERQISASLEHPNIARLLDGGTP